MKKIELGTYKKILVFILILVTAASLSRYILGLNKQVKVLKNEKQNLLQELKKEKKAKERLIQDNLLLKKNLQAAQGEAARLKEEATQNLKVIEQLNAQLMALKRELPVSAEEKSGLEAKLNELARQKNELRTRLDSIAQLKKVIQELKRQMRKAAEEIMRKTEAAGATEGNRGFLLRDGKLTIPARLKVEVRPIPSK